MKRNMDLIREILLQKEASKEPMALDCTKEEFAYHVALLKEVGFVEAIVRTDQKGVPSGAAIIRLTWAGHDFIDSARNDSVWQVAKEKIINSGVSWTVSLLSEVLKELAKQQLSRLGILGQKP